ncbi:MAG: carbamoyltransferase family protein [Chloroflexia bacterium]
MNVLGISCFYHDAAACLVQDGVVVAAAEEERFTRKKHDADLPRNAIAYCLKAGGITADQLDAVGFYEKPLLKFERILQSALGNFPQSWRMFTRAMPVWFQQKLWIQTEIESVVGKKIPLYFIEHHLSHAASAFLVSPFSEAGILTFDGVGEWTTTAYGHGKGTEVELTKEIRFPHSLGLLYSAFTAHAGFEVNEGEYKLMGLAAYGQPTYYQQVREIVDLRDDGSFQLDMSYFAYHYSLHSLSDKFLRVFGPVRAAESPMEDRYANIASSIQKVTEEVMLTGARYVRQTTGSDYLCMAGGVALNCVANGRILREAGFKDIWVQPAAGDAGGSLGVASYLYHKLSGAPRNYVMRNAYLGPAYSNDEIKSFLHGAGVAYQEMGDDELVGTVGRLLAENNVIGWFQGRMEFGPRALGSRSILANASHPQMKDILNEKIKHREQFRPFAPAVLLEETPNYFALDAAHESPYMLLVADVHPQYRALLPAITHVDGTARLQTVTAEENGLYYRVIREFFGHTGVPVIVNTSFNVRGEPIVNTPAEAYNCFSHTDMDYLVLGNCLVSNAAKKIIAAYPGRKAARAKEEVIV